MNNKTIYLNFSDLTEETQLEILSIAEDDIRADEEEMKSIKETYGKDMVDTIVSERAERNLYSYNFVFNV